VKNNYPLPLISDVIENIGTKKMFTKMDLRWGYNNVRIKEKDEWKVDFITLEGLFQPKVMFFGLTNSPATFQAMMNELLKDLVNTGKVVSFINNIMVGTETEQGHDELVEVDFLEVVIGLERIRMKKEKVKTVLNWPVPKLVKDVQKFLGLANCYRRFVKGFVKIVRLLYELMRKEQK